MTAVGDRVGVIIGKSEEDENVILVAGYGVYAGDYPPETAVGFLADMLGDIPNPKLELDNGEVAWGCETWWGAEADIKEKLAKYEEAGYTIKFVSMQEYRDSYLASAANG